MVGGIRPRLRRVGLVVMMLAVTLTARVPTAYALTGTDGLVAIATSNGIEVFDPSGDGSDLHVLIPNAPELILQEPAWSPLGNRIAYTAWTDQGHSLWVARADGTNAHQVSAPGEYADDAAWSPDGRIAYLSQGGAVVIMDADGSHRVVVDPRDALGSDVYVAGRPAWTADGRLFLLIGEANGPLWTPFITDGDGTYLHLIDPDGILSSLRTGGGYKSYNWQFSSTGLVAFTLYEDTDTTQYVDFYSFDGTQLIDSPSAALGPASHLSSLRDVTFSPGGQRAVLASPGFPYPDKTTISTLQVDLSQPDPFNFEMGFNVPGTTAGIDWQPHCSVTGTPGDDVLVGTPVPNLICGLGGDDAIYGMGGNDMIYGGPGDDIIYGGRGNDVIVGGWGPDTIFGNRGRDLINSRRDSYIPDTVNGGTGHDVCLHDRADILTSC